MELYDEMIKQIVKARDNDSLILFIGAGISANSNLPTWSKLIEELKKDLGLSDNDNLDYLKIAQIYYDTFGQQEYLQKIEELFKNYPTPKPNKIHELILKINPKHIITTNYDSLMEQAARQKGLSYNVLAKDTDIPYVSSNRYIIKMHGDLQNKNIVLKESDYQDYEQNFPMISTLIKSLIMNNTILFIGYSLNDSTFNAIYRMISNRLASHAKHSYFYTPEYQNDLLVTYYKNKGIHVISNGHIDDHSHLGENTESFLNDIINPNIPLEEKIWNKLKHLDKLAFIDSILIRDSIHNNLNKPIRLQMNNQIIWSHEEDKIELSDNGKLARLLINKTNISHFLGNDINNSDQINPNNILQKGYDFYKEYRFKEALIEFNYASNQAINEEDYLTYLIAELNKNIVSQLESPFTYLENPKKHFNNKQNLNEIVTTLVQSANKDISKIATFFNTYIIDENYLYNKYYQFEYFLNKLKHEQQIHKAASGFSYNHNLDELNLVLDTITNFIDSNCLCIHYYGIYKQIINIYFECMLIAYNNYLIQKEHEKNIYHNNNSITQISSIIKSFNLDKIKLILFSFKYSTLKDLFQQHKITRLECDSEIVPYIINECISICQNEKNLNLHLDRLKTLILFLTKCELKQENFEILFNLIKKIYISDITTMDCYIPLLRYYKKYITEFSFSLKEQLFKFIQEQIDYIVFTDIHYKQSIFTTYTQILNNLKEIDTHNICTIRVDSIYEKLYIAEKADNVDNIIETIKFYKEYIFNFYPFLDDEEKNIINHLLKKYENNKLEDLDIDFIFNAIIDNIYPFTNKRKEIINYFTIRLGEKTDSSVQIFPNPQNTQLGYLGELINCNYLSLDDVKILLTDSLKGIHPLFDWEFFNEKSDDTVQQLLRQFTLDSVLNSFCKSNEDKQLVYNWLAKKYKEDNEWYIDVR